MKINQLAKKANNCLGTRTHISEREKLDLLYKTLPEKIKRDIDLHNCTTKESAIEMIDRLSPNLYNEPNFNTESRKFYDNFPKHRRSDSRRAYNRTRINQTKTNILNPNQQIPIQLF